MISLRDAGGWNYCRITVWRSGEGSPRVMKYGATYEERGCSCISLLRHRLYCTPVRAAIISSCHHRARVGTWVQYRAHVDGYHAQKYDSPVIIINVCVIL